MKSECNLTKEKKGKSYMTNFNHIMQPWAGSQEKLVEFSKVILLQLYTACHLLLKSFVRRKSLPLIIVDPHKITLKPSHCKFGKFVASN